jgi:hypothetical protein
MQRQPDISDTQSRTKAQGLKRGLAAESRLKYRQPPGGTEYMAMARAGMVCVGMGEHCAVDSTPGVNEKPPCGAEQPLGAQDHQVIHGHCSKKRD